MEQPLQSDASAMIDALTGWWNLAGVDGHVGDVSINWLEADKQADVGKIETFKGHVPVADKGAEAASASIEWPADLEELKQMIKSGAALPGNSFGTQAAAPVGQANSEIMIVSDLPDQDDISSGNLHDGINGKLLKRMLALIGIDLNLCYSTALATTRPPTGEIPDTAFALLSEFLLHQITLVKPRSLIILGSSATKALLNEELPKARANLGNINHSGNNMKVLTTFHPRTLIARPALKKQAWKDLQMFAKRSAP